MPIKAGDPPTNEDGPSRERRAPTPSVLTRAGAGMLKTKSVSSPIHRKGDGLRILATRFRGRGLPKSRYHVWMASLGPSERLLKAIQQGGMSWARFAREYRAELLMSGRIDARSATIKNHGQKFTLRLIGALARMGPVTLLCHCAKDEPRCHRHILRRLILGSRL